MMKTNSKLAIVVIVVINFLLQSELKAQTYASTEDHNNVGICIGCGITNAGNSVDANTSTSSTLNVLAGVLGAYVYQNLYFPSDGASGDILNLVIEDPSGGILDINLLGGLSIRSYNNGISNNDTWNNTNISLGLLNGSTTKYIVSIPLSYSIDQIQVRLNAGLAGTISLLRIYYASITDPTLPISFIEFKAQTISSEIKLNWQMINHPDGNVCIEKSIDGKIFKELRNIKIESNETQFEFIDPNTSFTVCYYRLKFQDNDHIFYSDIIVSDPVLSDIMVYPNPFTDNLKITMKTSIEEEVSILITDQEGQSIYSNTLIIDGNIELTEINQFKNGIYYLSVYTNKEVYNKIIVKK